MRVNNNHNGNMMAGLREIDKSLFPIKNIKSVIQLFKNQLEDNPEPDLALLSIVTGAFENELTCRPQLPTDQLPILELHTIERLYAEFHHKITGTLEPRDDYNAFATRELVKRVSDVIWNSLMRTYYKDRAHLQSLFSYLNGRKLDCFGVALAVVAGCQALGYADVHLALSEDHAWVVFGAGGGETAEVTWHGRGNEDKRGQEVARGLSSNSWLYLNNRPVVCTRHMEVAALVSAINPTLNAAHDAFEVAQLQQELLWLLYDLGHLKKYPMAIGNLGDLEEIAPMGGRMHCRELFQEAITSARSYYANHHVYPYTYQGGYFYRNKMYEEAFESWANASDVIRLYNYSRDDEEIYKEFLEIANELIPHIMKLESSGFSAATILKKPECFAHLLRFYDGICQWEEGSATPVLHIGWARPLVNTISKFDAAVRAQVHIACGRAADDKRRANGHHNNNTTLTNNNEDGRRGEALHPSIEALTAACGEKLLNPEYLLQGDGSPFVGSEPSTSREAGEGLVKKEDEVKILSDLLETDTNLERKDESKGDKRTTIVLHSHKMKELKDLLLAEKLNTHAISLHLTAQSQVQVGKRSRNESTDSSGARPKRNRRE